MVVVVIAAPSCEVDTPSTGGGHNGSSPASLPALPTIAVVGILAAEVGVEEAATRIPPASVVGVGIRRGEGFLRFLEISATGGGGGKGGG